MKFALEVGGRYNESKFDTSDTTTVFDQAVRLVPAVEFHVFRYEESTRRQVRILYAAGPRYFDYEEETILLHRRYGGKAGQSTALTPVAGGID